MSYRISNFSLSNLSLRASFLRALASCVLIILFTLGLSGCANGPEHTGPATSNGTAETTLAAKPPMNNVGDTEVSEDEAASLEVDEAEEGQADSEGTDDTDDQGNQRQAGSGSSVTSSGNSSSGSGSSNAGSSSSGSGGSSGSGSSGGSSSGGGSSNQGSGQGSTQSGGSGSSGGNSGGSGTGSSGSTGNNSTQTPAPQTITVSIEICARLAHAADPAAVAGISNAGVILPRRNVTVPTGASVRQALDATGVRLNARGAYIAGIGGLSEGDLGPQSGWMFSVNGAFSSQSASAHRLNAGDVIAWRYTINGGADLGASW